MSNRDPIAILTMHDDPPVLHDQLPGRYLGIIAEAAERLLAAADAATMVDELFATIRGELRLDAFFHYRSDGERLALAAHDGLPPHQVRDPIVPQAGQPVCDTVARDRRRLHATAIRTSTDPDLAFLRGMGLNAYLDTPLVHGDRLLGTLGFGRRGLGRFDPDEVTVLQTLCSYVALAEHRLRIEADLRRGLERQDRLLQELNHRVRNALQLAIGIVGMEFQVPAADTPLAAKRRAVARLEVMAIAHRPLYAGGDPGEVDVATLLHGVVEQTVGRDVAILATAGHALSVERGVSLALVIHALLLDAADLQTIRMTREAADVGSRLAIALMAPSLAMTGGGEAVALPRPTELLLRQLHAAIDRDGSGLTIRFPSGS